VSALDLTTAVPTIPIPVFFFLGRHDHVIDAGTSSAYFESLAAPLKKLVWFEEWPRQPRRNAQHRTVFHRDLSPRMKPDAGPNPGSSRRTCAQSLTAPPHRHSVSRDRADVG
jgi:fermentation-respiration switch protein FrsA (DUF1100 family)